MKRAGACVAAVAAFVALVAPAPVSAAGPSPDERRRQIDAEVRRLRTEMGEVAEQEAGLLAELSVSRRLRQELDGRVAALDAQIAATESELSAVSAELDRALAAQQAAADALRRARADLEEATRTLQEQAVHAFIHYGTQPTLGAFVVRIDEAQEASRRTAYVDAVARKQAEIVERHRRLRRDTTELEAAAARARTAAAAHREEIAARKAGLEAARAEQATARAEVQAELANEQALLAKVQTRRGEYQRRLQELERESSDIASMLRRRQAGQGSTAIGAGVLGPPLARPRITSNYGYRTHPIYGDRRLHAGIDLGGATGTPVLAAGDGVVVYAGWRGGYGNTVVIDHGRSLATLYAHQSALAVQEGQRVRRGQVVGALGSTGNSTGPHLHFEVRVAGAPVDPLRYL